MKSSKSRTQRFRECILLGIAAAVLFVSICPAIEENRLEARIGYTYYQVREIAEANVGKTLSDFENLELGNDPWEQPYLVAESDEGWRVISAGPNQVTPEEGLDDDDIHSDMASSPSDAIFAAKQFRLLIALSLPVIWFLFTVFYLWPSN